MTQFINNNAGQIISRPEQITLIAQPAFAKDLFRSIFSLLPNQDFLHSRTICLIWLEATNHESAWKNRLFNLTIGELRFCPPHARFITPLNWESDCWKHVRQKIGHQCLDIWKLAEEQNTIAETEIGLRYINGHMHEGEDRENAIPWLGSAATKGNAKAQWALATCYLNGLGIEENKNEAIRLFRLAADQGLAEGNYELAHCYVYGNGVEKNPQEAIKFFTLAAAQGFAEAQCDLAYRYVTGAGVQKNLKEAVKLYNLAAAQGYQRAIDALTELAKLKAV